MSADDGNGDGDDGGGPGRREVAHRVFAAEFDDATVSYRESDEERAPNYVVTPTGARVNRLFAVGALTEVEPVNDDVVRARIADPTGVFVSYAGQYQPDALAFFERADPPAFVALTAKARTFEPDDGDRIYTSARPESVNEVDADTRDRWVVSAAEATLERIALFEEALALDARGDDLRDRLRERGCRDSLAAGIPVAIERYGTTTAYLEAVRRTAVEALELVAGDRDAVEPLDVAPDEGGTASVGPTPTPAAVDAERTPDGADAADAGDATDGEATADGEPADGEPADAQGPTAAGATDATESAEAADTTAAAGASAGATPDASDAGAPDASGATGVGSGRGADAGVGNAGAAADGSDVGAETTGAETADPETETVDAETAGAERDDDADATGEPGASDDLGDFDDGSLGDFDATDDAGAADAAGVDEDEMYELDDDERREVAEEYGAEFSTGTEVDDPGEADIDVPEAGDSKGAGSAEAADDEDGATAVEASAPAGDAAADAGAPGGTANDAGTATSAETADGVEEATATDDGDATAADADDDREEGADADGDAPDAGEVDLEDAAVAAMDDLDDGDGADREAVVASVVDDYGADPGAVEDAIQDALMSGRCYEPSEDALKPI